MNAVTDPIKALTISFAALPALGAALEGGKFYGITTLKDGTHAAVILLPNKAQERMGWKAAMKWAEEAGGVLPSRPVSALLYANAKDQFEPTWYWTSEEDGASCAWFCVFDYGNQDFNRKYDEGSAVSVRMIPLVL